MRAPRRILLATSASLALNLGLPEKRCQNVYLEPDPTDPKRLSTLIETPGSLAIEDFVGACRGLAQADGHASGVVLIAQGTTCSTYNPTTEAIGALTGTLPGTDRWDICFSELEGLILVNGGLLVSDGSAITGVTDVDFATLLSNHSQTAFTSVDTIGQRGLFTYGSRLGFTAVLDFDNTQSINYYTAESAPDGLIAVRVLGQDIFLFGTRTIEIWGQTFDDDDPFALQPGRVIRVGCLCRDGIVRTDNSMFWVADDRTVRRLGPGDAAEIISEPWVVRLFKRCTASQIVGFTYADEGHIFVGFRTPFGCPVYDAMTEQWHTRITNLTDTWRWMFVVEAGGSHYVADEDGIFDHLSRDYTSEHRVDVSTMGTEIVREFTAFGDFGEFESIPNLMLVASKGVGVSTGQGSNPVILMRISFDGGQTWSSWRSRALGAQGAYDAATIWRMNGSAKRRGAMFHFLKSDPAQAAYKALQEVAA